MQAQPPALVVRELVVVEVVLVLLVEHTALFLNYPSNGDIVQKDD